jgi:uncharacterized protein (TIGR02145 family)
MKISSGLVINGFIALFTLNSCGDSSSVKQTAQTKKVEEKNEALQEIAIGKQRWASKNLAVANFRNGDTIYQATSDEEWQRCAKEKKPAWCYYKNDPSHNAMYGRLYNWYAVTDARGLAPEGWEVATEEDWQTLEKNLTDSAGWKLKSTTGWEEQPGNNSSGFGAVGNGLRQPKGLYQYLNRLGCWWTSSKGDSSGIDIIMPVNTALGLAPDEGSAGYGYGVRCIKRNK